MIIKTIQTAIVFSAITFLLFCVYAIPAFLIVLIGNQAIEGPEVLFWDYAGKLALCLATMHSISFFVRKSNGPNSGRNILRSIWAGRGINPLAK